jgi:hypothetical protein
MDGLLQILTATLIPVSGDILNHIRLAKAKPITLAILNRLNSEILVMLTANL